ncbi:phage antirepressor N-terminal domain-containing protein [Xenorhabdus sp. KK7.4]|uniref:phage antirepressor N-terminal domain-containing protein n=1 Tax=Xenorhabdus sp. KK7.4 TaxID=1851572 RepID=UPI000C062DAB|nr:phage antirepressor N-terminal domain-containing protein [Xenorhabdus sp. KK7.4]PHM52477.1 antirepressor [Xenorhabdus sp. KK7.4]
MSIVTVKESSPIINVPFYGADLFIVNYNGVPYVPLKPITEGMGLSWASQCTKLKTRIQASVEKIPILTKQGLRIMSCLALDELAGWLAMINSNKVKAAIRDNVIWYQEECDDVLQVYWVVNEAKRKEQAKPQPTSCRYLVKLEVYDHHLKKTNIFTGGVDTPEGIVSGVARKYGYSIEKMISLPEHIL